MSGRGEGDGRPYEGRVYQDGVPYDPVPYATDPADPAGQTGQAGQSYGAYGQQAPDPAYGYGEQAQQSQQSQQSYPGTGTGTGAGGYEPGAYETPGYGQGYQSPQYDSPQYDNTPYDNTSYGNARYDGPAYQEPTYQDPAYGRSPYGYSPDQGQGQDPGRQSGQSYGTVPPQEHVRGADYDSGAYAAYDGPAYPATEPEGLVGGAQAAGPGTDAGVRRTGSDSPTNTNSTTGSFRVQVPGPARPPGAPSRRPAPAAPTGPAAPAAPATPAAPGSGRSRPGRRSGAAEPPGGRPPGGRPPVNRERVGYADDEFDFVDDDADESEDVIDWLKFAETRVERRDERRRQLRTRLIALVMVIALGALGAGGYYAYTTYWAEDSKAADRATGGAVLIQLRGAGGEASASAVLADDPGRGTGAMITVPSVTVVNTPSAGPTGIGDLMVSDGAGASRDALAQLIGIRLDGSWVVSEPVLQGLVDMVGGIELAADVEVKGTDGKVVVPAGPSRVDGAQARAYAAFRVPGEAPALGAERFGRVVQSVLKVLPTDAALVADLLRNLANVADPSLPDARLAQLLTSLAKAVQAQQFKSADLPVQPDGALDVAAASPVVKDLLGGTVQVAKAEGPARVMLTDASGKSGAQESARVKTVNAGYSYVPGGIVEPKAKPTSVVQYSDDARRATAVQLALTLGLPETAAQKTEGQMLADIVVTLGQDYKLPTPS